MANSDRSEILRALKVFMPPGEVIELRIPNAGQYKTISGYFDDPTKLMDKVTKLADAPFPGYYITVNDIDHRLLARYENRVKNYAEQTTTDDSVERLRWLIVDLDPERPSGIPSMDSEHLAALEMSQEIKRWLIQDRGWPENAFVLVDSGNGAYALAHIDLENTQDNVSLLKTCLESLDFIFSDEVVGVDLGTYNPARILRLPGTMNRKGDGTSERPHRMAKLLEVPEVMGVVQKKKLEELAKLVPCESKTSGEGSFDPVKYAESHGSDVIRTVPWNGWTLALLDECPFDPNHKNGDARIGVGPKGERHFGCFHSSCRNNHWKQLKELWGAPDEKPNAKKNVIKERIPAWIKAHHFKTFTDTGVMYRYDHGVYLADGEIFLGRLIEAEFGDITTDKFVRDVIGKVKRRTYIERELVNNQHVLNVKNGLIDLETLELLPHTPDCITTAQLGVVYNPNAKAPRIERFLEEVAKTRDIPLIEEILGWLLWPDYNVHKAVMLLGPGRNGKGTLLRLITAFIGKVNVSNVTLQDLVADRFAKADLYGKLANIGGDLPSKDLSDTAAFRNLTGGDDNRAQEKYRHAFNFRNTAKLMFSANVLPRSPDDTFAFYSRWILIEFKNIFDVQKGTADPDLEYKLTTPEELSGLLNIALSGLARLRANGWKFSYDLTVNDVEMMYKRNSNPVLAFLMDECEADQSGYIEKQLFYSKFAEYVKNHNLRPLTMTRFAELLQDQTEIPVSSYRPWVNCGDRPHCWRGVKFKGLLSHSKSSSSEEQSRPSRVSPTPNYSSKKGYEVVDLRGEEGIDRVKENPGLTGLSRTEESACQSSSPDEQEADSDDDFVCYINKLRAYAIMEYGINGWVDPNKIAAKMGMTAEIISAGLDSLGYRQYARSGGGIGYTQRAAA